VLLLLITINSKAKTLNSITLLLAYVIKCYIYAFDTMFKVHCIQRMYLHFIHSCFAW